MIKYSYQNKEGAKMIKKLYIAILLSHLLVPISLLFPILKISESLEGQGYYNVINYIILNEYTYVTVLLIIFSIVELCGLSNAIYGLTINELNRKNISMSFLFGFSSAILGAMFISTGSYLFFIICAISFVVISYASIRLMKLEQ